MFMPYTMGNVGHPAGPRPNLVKERHLLLQFFLLLLITSVFALEGEGIVGGKISSVGEYPYHVSIQIKNTYMCSGGIINQQYVVTAAHCLVMTNGKFITKHVKVVGGIDDLNSYQPTRQTWDVTEIYIPQSYFTDFVRDLSGDIALLKLKQVINFSLNRHLGYLELPSEHDNFFGREAFVTGFGYNEVESIEDPVTHQITKTGKSDGKLRSLNTTVLTLEECSAQKKYRISNNRLCTRIAVLPNSEPQGPCNGDSGGPLVVNKKVLIGVVSVGAPNCDERTGPSTYTSVTSYLDFITGVLENHSKHPVIQLMLQD